MSTFTVCSQYSIPILKMYKSDKSIINTPLADIDSLVHVTIVYHETIKIGTQLWASRNLDVSTYRNGDPIRYASTPEEWQDAANKGEGAWCYYGNDPKNGEIYGKLYNWYAVKDARGLAPSDYHIPSDLEWSLLSEYLGGEKIAGFKMKSTSGWRNYQYIYNGNGDNSSGFNGLPGGYCNYKYGGNFYGITESAYFWSSSEYDAGGAWNRNMSIEDSRVIRQVFDKIYGFSVRCLADFIPFAPLGLGAKPQQK
jgi:uncharacterized protein (TIGR02145 family)